MFDIQSRAWSSKILALLGLDPDKLPSVSLASDLLGAVTKEAAQVTGLRAGTPVAVGAGDFPVALVGSGVTRPGMACDITGTSTLTALLVERPTVDPKISNLQCIIGGWAAFTIVDAGGDAVRWARSVFHDQACSYEQMVSMAAAAPAGSEQLLFLPYLNAERLARKSNSRAQLFGLTSRHSAAHLHRAVLEGIAFASRRNMELMKSRGGRFERMIAAAGGAKSRLWLEIKASIYNCPILIPYEPECGVLGCAMLAGCAAGLFSNLEAVVSQQVRYDKEIVPNAAWSERYEKMRSLFDDLYETSERYWDRFES
jgi:xylulokinase